MSKALAPLRVAHILPLEVLAAERAGRNAVALPQGRIASDIELISIDERRNIARYEVRVANDSPTPLTCFAYAVHRHSDERPVTCASLAIAAYSGVAITFDVQLPRFGDYERIVVELRGEGIELRSDAPAHRRSSMILVRRGILAGAGALFLLLGTLLGIAQPQIIAFDGPSQALGGMSPMFAYEARGLSALEYTLSSRDGGILVHGQTHPGIGTVRIPLPRVPHDSAMTLNLSEHSLFGGDERNISIVALATPSPRFLTRNVIPATIQQFHVDRDHLNSGDQLIASSQFSARSATISMIDSSGALASSLVLQHSDITRLRAPAVDHPENFRLVLHVERDGSTSESQIGLLISPAIPKAQQFQPIQGTPISIGVNPIGPGDPIALHAQRFANDLHVALQDHEGIEVAATDIDSHDATLQAPLHPNGTSFTLLISFTDGNGTETVVYPLTISTQAVNSK